MRDALTLFAGIVILLVPAALTAGDCGDVDNSGAINILDVTFLINYLYKGGPAPDPLNSADVNNDDAVNILDATYTINYLYMSGPDPDCGLETDSVTDIDGNVYQTVKIGDQWWMAENLKVTHYRNGDPIPNVTDSATWCNLTTGAYCHYDNNEDNVDIYGRLYNAYTVYDSRHLAPEGWHVPSDAEWKQLEMYLGMSQAEADGSSWRGTDEGGKLKETGTTNWDAPNTGATNESGFTALPGGFRNVYGYFISMAKYAYFCSSTALPGDSVWMRYLNNSKSQIARGVCPPGNVGFSIRCVKNDFEPGTILIETTPDSINAPWSLSGPGEYNSSGNGDQMLTDFEPGDYTIIWENVTGWITPSGDMQTLVPNDTVTFSGIYIEDSTPGTIVINTSPDSLDAGWSLEGPSGFSAGGNGDSTLTDLEQGDYTITWEDISEWITPSSQMKTLVPGETVTFYGTYIEQTTGTVTDIDGNVYQTVKIGDQWWMAENLKVTHYRNGALIPNVEDGNIWDTLTAGAYCNFDNDDGNVADYGRLYNWRAVDDGRNIAPAGWHVPTDEEWKQLEMFLGMSQASADSIGYRGTDEGGKLKEAGSSHWSHPNTGATNESGFTARGAGYRDGMGNFCAWNYRTFFWTSTEQSSFESWYRRLEWDEARSLRSAYGYGIQPGFSVRCVKD